MTVMADQRPPSSNEAVVKALGASAVFGVLSVETRHSVVAAGSPLTLGPGEILCQAGDAGDALYVLVEGEIEVLAQSEGGRHARLAALGPSAVAGEMAVLDGGARSADMVATRRSLLWRIPRAALLDALASEPRAAVALIAEMSRRLRASNALVESANFLDLGGRLAKILLEESNARGVTALTQTELARRISASREKVNRKLHAWADNRWIDLTPGGVHVLDSAALHGLIAALRRR